MIDADDDERGGFREPPLGVVLRATPLRESDLVVTLFTDLHGQVSAVARGARKSKRRFSGALSLLVLGRYRLGRSRGDLWTLESADVVREWTALSSDPVAVGHASYAAEILGALLPVDTPEPEALDVIVSVWDALAANGPSPGALRAAELALLELSGNAPAIDHCAACGTHDLNDEVAFDPSRGGVVCRACVARSRSAGIRPLSAGARTYLSAIRALGMPLLASPIDRDPQFAAADRLAARDALVAMVTGLAGRPLRSLAYLAKLGAASRRDDGSREPK